MELMDTDPELGTYPDQIVRAVRQLRFEAYYKGNATLEELESSDPRRYTGDHMWPGVEMVTDP
jgi:hypothetical protein